MKQIRGWTGIALVALGYALASATPAASDGKKRPGNIEQAIAVAPNFHDPMLARALDSAYFLRSPELRRAFFIDWLDESDALRASHSKDPPPVDDIIAIFMDFYTPDTTTLSRVLGEMRQDTSGRDGPTDRELRNFIEFTAGSPGDAGYLVVQSMIDYRLQSKLDTTDICAGSIYDLQVHWAVVDSVTFYPPVQSQHKPVLYLTDRYREALEDFLSIDSPNPYVASRAAAFDGVRDRIAFIRPQISVSGLHWGGWQYLTYPVLNSVYFSRDMTRARITYRESWCSGGDACYVKSDGKWEKEKNLGSWIE